jgi:hypothetical protein
MTKKEQKELEEDKKLFMSWSQDLDNPINTYMVILSSLCAFLLEKPNNVKELCQRMFLDFQESNALEISTEVKKPDDLTEVVAKGLEFCVQFDLVLLKAGRYFLTEKGFKIGKQVRSFKY